MGRCQTNPNSWSRPVSYTHLVKVVELDYESVAYLRENFPALEDNIIEDDFLKLNLEKLFDGKPFVDVYKRQV